MLRFLTKFHLATRVYGGFLAIGAYTVLLCFLAMTAVGTVQNKYTKANAVIDASRQLNVLETDFYALDQSLFFFAKNRNASEKKKVESAFSRFNDHAAEIAAVLTAFDADEKYKKNITEVNETYKTALDGVFSLYEKSAEVEKKVRKLADKSVEKLVAMIEDVSLPSASFALNNLREQLEDVLRELDAEEGKEIDRVRLTAGLAALKKAVASAKQAEMVNTKQLKVVSASLTALDEEISRKLKIDDSLRDKILQLSSESAKNIEKLSFVLDGLGATATGFVVNAENDKIMLQKLFVFCAAFGGVLAVVLSFLSLYGIRYPLNRLVESAQEIAHGNRSVLIHFTERGDEVGALARALSALLAHLKDLPVLSDKTLLGRPDTYGAPVSYVPLGAPNANGDQPKDESEVAYFGQGVGVDTESQLCQMLGLLQQLSSSASEMTADTKYRFNQCQEQLAAVAEVLNYVHGGLDDLISRSDLTGFDSVKAELRGLFDFLQAFSPFVESMRSMADSVAKSAGFSTQTVQRANDFVTDLFEWAKATLDLTMQVRCAATDTKILALNASIEAAKTGEKAKTFGTVALDIRRQTQKTEDAVAGLIERLKVVQQGACNFAEVVKSIERETCATAKTAKDAANLAQDRKSEIEQALASLQSAGNENEMLRNTAQSLLPLLKELPGRLDDAERQLPFVERQLNSIRQKVDDFVAVLPTYEEEQDPG